MALAFGQHYLSSGTCSLNPMPCRLTRVQVNQRAVLGVFSLRIARPWTPTLCVKHSRNPCVCTARILDELAVVSPRGRSPHIRSWQPLQDTHVTCMVPVGKIPQVRLTKSIPSVHLLSLGQRRAVDMDAVT